MIKRLTNDIKIYGKIHQKCTGRLKISISNSMKIINIERSYF
jgi:hypothetical protein